ncbi:AraC family transcriptional regulator [Salipaludibacillus neizhouensis]|uniref:AraC family transcriptional regulator n=1 Tax=Salipaludibacillus neizhouensis TaxID=885475 RepID=A0A3A9K1N7_9BACI|nr:AraC family transcriptional regulator [Salipaludibacillus neizhouensis]RKL65168.1 AraC family transcriptional regulator [Salipaludibacillus neizhouensis]
MKTFPMKLQLTVILFFIMAIPIAVLTWYSGDQILDNSENAIAESSLAELNANRMLKENAMNNLSQNTAALTSTRIFDSIEPYKNYADLFSNFRHLIDVKEVQMELIRLNRMIEGAYSTFFYLNDSDYVVSTDKGVMMLGNYESLDWIEEALVDRRGIRGVWYPRKLDSGLNVLSYVLPLDKLSTNTEGIIVVNILESQLENYFSSSYANKQEYLIMDSDGYIISHSDKSFILDNGNKDPIIREILNDDLKEGYTFREVEGDRMLYTWSRSQNSEWLNVGVYSVNKLMNNTHTLHQNIIDVTLLLILIGFILTLLLATWLSEPARKIVKNLNLLSKGIKGRNELAILDLAFKSMQEKEETLHVMLDIREQDSRNLAIYNLIRGEFSKHVLEIFTEPFFLIAVVSIDQYRDYVIKNNSETRSYHWYLFTTHCDRLLPEDVNGRCVYQGEGSFVIVINYGQSEVETIEQNIQSSLLEIMDKAEEIMNSTVTIGVSSPTTEMDLVPARFSEAMEAIKYRMVKGSGGIINWNDQKEHDKKYIYPVNSERRILNFLDNNDLDSIMKELEFIGNEIRSAEYISYDNILFIYLQLVGICIKHLRENNVSTARIFAGRGNIYASLASIDTLDELEEYLCNFFEEIIQYLKQPTVQNNDYGERILHYLNNHYQEEVDFKEMAKTIGISYSYMRRIVYETTGQSLIEHLNLRRIEKAKQMLLESDLTITEIAAEVGYNNVQSFNRFFRKFEGMPPSNYRQIS